MSSSSSLRWARRLQQELIRRLYALDAKGIQDDELVNEAALALFARLDELLAGRQEALVLFEMPGAITLAPEGWVCLKRLGKGAHQPTVCVYRRG